MTKELLSEVLRSELYGNEVLEYGYRNPTTLWVRTTMATDFIINIYELAHKCKEWAISKNFVLSSWLATKYDARCEVGVNGAYFIDKTEPEVILKASGWILDNKGEL